MLSRADLKIQESVDRQLENQPREVIFCRRCVLSNQRPRLTIDAEGNVYLTGRGVTVFNKTGKQIEQIEVAEPWTANVTFGGKDRNLLFITASKNVYGLKMRVKGAK